MKADRIENYKLSVFYYRSYDDALEKYNFYVFHNVKCFLSSEGDLFKVIVWRLF